MVSQLGLVDGTLRTLGDVMSSLSSMILPPSLFKMLGESLLLTAWRINRRLFLTNKAGAGSRRCHVFSGARVMPSPGFDLSLNINHSFDVAVQEFISSINSGEPTSHAFNSQTVKLSNHPKSFRSTAKLLSIFAYWKGVRHLWDLNFLPFFLSFRKTARHFRYAVLRLYLFESKATLVVSILKLYLL